MGAARDPIPCTANFAAEKLAPSKVSFVVSAYGMPAIKRRGARLGITRTDCG